MKPLLCCDLDSVLCDTLTPTVDRINQTFNLDLHPNQITSYHYEPLVQPFITNPRAWLDDLFADKEFMVNCPLILPSLVGLRKIRGLSRAVHIVTARDPSTRDFTTQWLEDYGVPYDKLVFSSEKAQYCRDVGAKYIIEDAGHHAEDCHSYGIGVFLVDYAYNRYVEPRGGLWRVNTLLEVPALMAQDHS